MTASFHLYQHYYLFNHIYHRLLSCLWETFANHLLNIRKLTVLSGIWRSFYWIFAFFQFSTSLCYCLFLPLSSLTYSLTSNIVKEKTQIKTTKAIRQKFYWHFSSSKEWFLQPFIPSFRCSVPCCICVEDKLNFNEHFPPCIHFLFTLLLRDPLLNWLPFTGFLSLRQQLSLLLTFDVFIFYCRRCLNNFTASYATDDAAIK